MTNVRGLDAFYSLFLEQVVRLKGETETVWEKEQTLSSRYRYDIKSLHKRDRAVAFYTTALLLFVL